MQILPFSKAPADSRAHALQPELLARSGWTTADPLGSHFQTACPPLHPDTLGFLSHCCPVALRIIEAGRMLDDPDFAELPDVEGLARSAQELAGVQPRFHQADSRENGNNVPDGSWDCQRIPRRHYCFASTIPSGICPFTSPRAAGLFKSRIIRSNTMANASGRASTKQ